MREPRHHSKGMDRKIRLPRRAAQSPALPDGAPSLSPVAQVFYDSLVRNLVPVPNLMRARSFSSCQPIHKVLRASLKLDEGALRARSHGRLHDTVRARSRHLERDSLHCSLGISDDGLSGRVPLRRSEVFNRDRSKLFGALRLLNVSAACLDNVAL